MKGFNLSNFKKMKEDKDWATLIHKDGHFFNIAKGMLSHLQRKQLEALEMHEQTQYMAEGGETQSSPVQDSAESIVADAQAQAPQAPEAQVAPEVSPPIQAQPQSPAPTNAPPQPSLGSVQNTGLTAEQKANTAQAQAIGTEGRQEAGAIQGVQDQIAKLPTQTAIVQKNKESNDNLLKAYQNSTVDPDKFWDNHSKIKSGIGVLLSSFGQALGGGDSNKALDNLHGQIQNEIERQKSEQAKSLNLYKLNREALGDDLSANLATQNQLYTGLKYKIDQTAAQNKGPIALANAQKANAQIQQAIDGNNFKLSLLQPTSDNPDPASRVQFLVPENARPAVNKEIAEAQNTVRAAPGILEAFDQAAQDARPLSGGVNTSVKALIPGMHTPGQQAFLGRMGPTVQDAEGTVRQAAFNGIENNMMPRLGDSDETIAVKRKTLHDYIRSKASAPNSKAYGIDLSKYPTTNTANFGQKQAAQPGVQYEKQIINGKAYMVPVGKN